MGALIGGVFIVVIVMVIAGIKGTAGGYDALVAQGIPARGILLQVAPMGTRAPSSNRQRPFERRGMVIDVEIPGQAPYEITVNQLVPLNLVRDLLPGATVELRVDRKNPSTVAIVGPGAFFAAQLLGQQRLPS